MAGKKPFLNMIGPSLPFHMPNIQGRMYRPGRQPFNPGESQIDNIDAGKFRLIPWPNAVQSLKTLASNPGIPRDRAMQIDNNSNAPLLQNILFLSGVAGKTRG